MRKVIRKHYRPTALALLLILLAMVPLTIAEEVVTEHRILTSAQQRLQAKITYSCREVPIETVLMQLAEQAQIDIIKSPKVSGNVTVKITEVPLEEALSQILAAHGYTYIASNSMIRVVPSSEVSTLRERMVTRIYHITYAEIENVAKALQKFLSKKGTMGLSVGTSDIMVTDIESKVKAIDNFIGEIDRETPQVLIEVSIYDVKGTGRLDVGIDWSAGRTTTWGASDADSVPSLGSEEGRPFAGGAHKPFITGSLTGTTDFAKDTEGVLEFGIINSNINISAFLRMQQENVSSTLLANPRVLVLDNETAKFKIVSEHPYEERAQTGQGSDITSIKFKEIGVELEVTPHIAVGSDKVRVHVKPTFSVITDFVGTIPVSDKREAETTLLVGNNQTVVIGGLRQKDLVTKINKIPFFGDLPLIGPIFRAEGEEEIDSEIIVFITPRIVTDPKLSETEKERLDSIEFKAPELAKTKAERSKEK